MPIHELHDYTYRGARALVLLHERSMRALLPAWWRAKAAQVKLPQTRDPDYASLESLLHHALAAARGYTTWLCEKLGLPDPGIDPAPEAARVQQDAESYVEHLLERSRRALAHVKEADFEKVSKSRWGVDISVECMMEHAVMHPERHRFQLEELLEAQGKA